MLRVVIDTNVFISALYLPASKPGTVVLLARRHQIRNLIAPAMLREVERVLQAKLRWDQTRAREAARQIENFSEVVQPQERLTVLADEPDNRILECAVAGQAAVIISGDQHLLQLRSYQGIAFLQPADFLSQPSCWPTEGVC